MEIASGSKENLFSEENLKNIFLKILNFIKKTIIPKVVYERNSSFHQKYADNFAIARNFDKPDEKYASKKLCKPEFFKNASKLTKTTNMVETKRLKNSSTLFNFLVFSFLFQNTGLVLSSPIHQNPSIYGNDRRCEIGNKNNECLSCHKFYMKYQNTTLKICLDKCNNFQYGIYVGHRIECKECHPACVDGCRGPGLTVSKNGCNRCKYGIEKIKGQKNCLLVTSESKFSCEKGYFLDRSNDQESNWTEHICRKCHSECISCISSGPYPEKDNCSCKNYQLIDYKNENKTICSNECPSGFKELTILSKTSEKLCIRCKEDESDVDPTTKKCIPKPTNNSSWSIFVLIILLLTTICACLFVGIFRRDLMKKWLRGDFHSDSDKKNKNQIKYESQISSDSVRTNMTLMPMEEIHLMPKQIKQWDNFYILEHHLKYKEDSNHLIGRGNFGPVYKGKLTKGNDSADVAIKVIDKNDNFKEAVLEATLLRTQLPMHPHIHKIFGVCMTIGTDLKLISPHRICKLNEYLKKDTKKIKQWRQYAFCAQIASGMDFLSKYGIIHRKLMASSILVKSLDHVEVSGFGLTNNITEKSMNNKWEIWRWSALECLENEVNYTQKSDIWSYGVVCWEIFTYCEARPYEWVKNVNGLKEFLESNLRLQKPTLCDTFTFNKIKRCWSKDTNERPNFEELYLYFVDHATKIREGRKVVIGPTQIETTNETLSNNYVALPVTSIMNRNENTPQKDDKLELNKESEHGYTNLSTTEELSSVEEGRIDPKIDNPNDEMESTDNRRSNQRTSFGELNEPNLSNVEKISPYINLSADTIPNDPDPPPILTRININEDHHVKIRQEKQNKILDSFLSEILYEVPQNLLSRKCKLIFSDNPNINFDLHKTREVHDISNCINGFVKESRHLETGRKLAMKSIRIPSYRRHDEKQNQRLKKVLQEIQHHLTLLDSPNIVQLYGYCCCSKELVLALELMKMDLKTFYKKLHEKEKMFPEDLMGCIGVSMTDALAYCMSKNILHRNLKPSNVLLDEKGNIKLCDFGESRILSGGETASKFVGTFYYLAPEIIENQPYDARSDIWSFGITLAEAAFGRIPYVDQYGMTPTDFSTLQECIRRVTAGEIIKRCLHDKYSNKVEEFLSLCLGKWENRPSNYKIFKLTSFYISFSEIVSNDMVVKAINKYFYK